MLLTDPTLEFCNGVETLFLYPYCHLGFDLRQPLRPMSNKRTTEMCEIRTR